MAPAPGSSLLNFRLAEKLGEGGMGEVWQATDTTLSREVALKFLPASLASDPDRLARFEREAKVLASLNHPGIAGIYGLHEASGIRFLAMELVPGEDLAQRLSRGPIPVAESIDIARQIAEAVEAAHDQGVVHRDLKPANVKITPEGKVKVLDFGLAKALDPVASGVQPAMDSRYSPTITSLGTVAGVILGTAAYMSPEQAKGRPVDRRTDIWAFGCILYEMLTGKRPFDGEGISEVLAAVIMAPIPFDRLPSSTPGRLDTLVHRCLERDPRRRLRDIGEARLALEDIQSGKADDASPAAASPTPSAAGRSPKALAGIMVAIALLAVLATLGFSRFFTSAPGTAPVRRFELSIPGPFRSSTNVSGLVAISPDGKSIAYVDSGKLFIRPLTSLDGIAIATPAEPSLLFWSPDSAFLAYAVSSKLWKVPAGGGESTVIADFRGLLTGGSGASWCPGGKIVFSSGEGSVMRVSASGGDFEEFIPLDKGQENDIHDPSCLPDGSVMFVPHAINGRPSTLWVFADGKRKQVLKLAADQDIWFPVYSPAGYVLYRRQPTNAGIWAVPFSLAKHEVTGDPFLVVAGGDVPSVSNDGTLVHARGISSRVSRMVWTDRTGKVLGPIGPPQEQWPFPELSPDNRSVAISAKENDLGDVWIHDVERGTRTRLSTSNTLYSTEAWSADGRTLLYSEGGAPPLTLQQKNADGSGELKSLRHGWYPTYSADGRYLIFQDFDADSKWDVWFMDLKAGSAAVPLVKTKASEGAPRLAPNGKYFAYSSDESGVDEIYLKRFPTGEGRWQISTGGGNWPRFNRRGDKLYYAVGDSIMEVDVDLGAEPKLGAPRELFKRKPLGWSLVFGWPPGFDVSADGNRFVIVEAQGNPRDFGGVVVEENWTQGIAK